MCVPSSVFHFTLLLFLPFGGLVSVRLVGGTSGISVMRKTSEQLWGLVHSKERTVLVEVLVNNGLVCKNELRCDD